jgi:hypothetical protein
LASIREVDRETAPRAEVGLRMVGARLGSGIHVADRGGVGEQSARLRLTEMALPVASSLEGQQRLS